MKVTLYTTKTCMYCNLAKNLLIEKKIHFHEINIESDLNIFKELIKKTNHKTVPQIFIDEKFIGGYTELCEYFKIKIV